MSLLSKVLRPDRRMFDQRIFYPPNCILCCAFLLHNFSLHEIFTDVLKGHKKTTFYTKLTLINIYRRFMSFVHFHRQTSLSDLATEQAHRKKDTLA
ncbi:hypothetical protein Sarmat_00631 [Rickettsiales endosymbiont of Paramecium tredecaurelia]|nr:hypothetical protein [Candidatus Sarmatiella mevalonica]